MDKQIDLPGDFPLPAPEQWRREAEKTMKAGQSLDQLGTRTYEGLELKPVYGAEDTRGMIQAEWLPGFSPFVRGTRPGGYLGHPWYICQKIDADDPGEYNRILTRDLKGGLNAVSLFLRLRPDQNDPPVGRDRGGGVPLSLFSDFSTALSEIDLGGIPLFIEAGFTALPMIMMLRALEENRGINLNSITGSIQADPLGMIGLRGRLPAPLESIFDQIAWVLKWNRRNYPGLKSIGVDVSHYHDSGATATMELAFALATGVEYVSRMMDRDVPPDQSAGAMRFTLGMGPFFFMEVAKLRAARMLWDAVIREFGGDGDSRKMTLNVRTAFYNQTRTDPHVNTVRTTTEALSAVLGGADSLQTNTHDESFAAPDSFSRGLARNIQLILYHEANLRQPVDPAGGSHYVERLTAELARESWGIFQEIEKQGGMLESLKTGFIQNQVSEIRAKKQEDLHRLKTGVVGTNIYCRPPGEPADWGKTVPREQPDRSRSGELNDREKPKNRRACHSSLDRLSQAVARADDERIVSCGAEALRNGATLGELNAALFPPGTGSVSLPAVKTDRLSEPFERLREKMGRHVQRTGHPPVFVLVSLERSGKTSVGLKRAKRILEIAGFGTVSSPESGEGETVMGEIRRTGARGVVICTDDADSETVIRYVRRLKRNQPDLVLAVAGNPKKHRQKLQEAGVRAFIYPGVDAFQVLRDLLTAFRIISE